MEQQLLSWPEEEILVGDEDALDEARVGFEHPLHMLLVELLVAEPRERVPCWAQLGRVFERLSMRGGILCRPRRR